MVLWETQTDTGTMQHRAILRQRISVHAQHIDSQDESRQTHSLGSSAGTKKDKDRASLSKISPGRISCSRDGHIWARETDWREAESQREQVERLGTAAGSTVSVKPEHQEQTISKTYRDIAKSKKSDTDKTLALSSLLWKEENKKLVDWFRGKG
jgi:hypothetical protein